MPRPSENSTKSAQIGASNSAFSPEKIAQLPSFYVGDWQVDVAANRLRRGNDEIKIETRVMEVLLYLASRPGVLVTREEIDRDVWAGRVVSY
jgi:DNA-binding winged helix-turn-helix (wHTH) protein